jgi:hypothetical protein
VSYVIDEDGFTATRGAVGTSCPWSAVEKLGESADHFFVLLPFEDALVIPKRAFGSPEDLSRFRRLVPTDVSR